MPMGDRFAPTRNCLSRTPFPYRSRSIPRSRTAVSRSAARVSAPTLPLPAPFSLSIPSAFPCVRTGIRGSRGRLPGHFPDAFECRNPLARDRLKLRAQLGRVVRDQLGTLAGAADLHVEALLRGEVRVPRLDRGDDVVDRAPLKRVHGRCPGMVEMPQLRVSRALSSTRRPSSRRNATRPFRDAGAPRRCGC